MGRKGIGKLAPFGICKKIEVISSGGQLVPGKGYLTTHFFLDFDKILQDTDTAVELEVGPRAALELSATAIILVHNHPSGDPTPSEADIKVTRDLIRAGQLLKIEVLDHVIIGRATSE